jgi:hypothetical protein
LSVSQAKRESQMIMLCETARPIRVSKVAGVMALTASSVSRRRMALAPWLAAASIADVCSNAAVTSSGPRATIAVPEVSRIWLPISWIILE